MRLQHIRHAALATAAMCLTPGAASAQQSGDNADRAKEWSQMRQEAVKASEVLRGNMTNGLNPIAQVKNLVLSENGDRVQYVLYEAGSQPWELYVGDGFAAFDGVDLETGSIYGGIDVRLADPKPEKAPQEIRITKDEADERLVSRILEKDMRLASGAHEIEDILIHPETGQVTHYVVGADEDSIFSEEKRAVRANEVRYANGSYRTSMSMQDIEKDQPYEEDWL